MKVGFVNFVKFAAVVVYLVVAGNVNAWATCPTSPYYSPDFTANGSCLAFNGNAGIPTPSGSASSISAWSKTATTVTFTATNSFVAGEPVILSNFTTSTFFNTLVFPVLSATTSSFTVAFTAPSGSTPGSEPGTATPMNVLQLTPGTPNQVGSAWDTTAQPVAGSFSTTFYFQVAPGANAGEGFAFVIQNSPAGTTAIGPGGCGLGFGGDAFAAHLCGTTNAGIPNSVAVSFKTALTYATKYPDINSVSIQNNPFGPNCVDELNCTIAENDLNNDVPPGPTLSDSGIHAATVTFTLSPTNAQSSCIVLNANLPCLDVILDGVDLFPTGVPFDMTSLGLTNGNAYVGFTGATSTNTESNDILSWVFTPAGASTTGNVGPVTPTTFNFQGGYDPTHPDTSGFNFSAVLTGSATLPVKAVLTDLPISTSVCTTLVQSTYPSAKCFDYSNAGGQGVDESVMFELTCPPAGECVSNTGDFPAVLGSQFAFDLTKNTPLAVDNFPPIANQSDGTLVFPPATGPFITPTETTVDTGLPSIGVLKGQGPDPIHPCTPYPNNTPPLFQSNQVIDFSFEADTSGGAKASSGNTNSCWVVTYSTQSELPTVSVTAPANNGNYPVNATPQTAAFTCSAVNAGASSVIGPYLTIPTGACVGNATFDTSTLGSHIYTANVTDSALNTNYQSVTYYVQAAPAFSGGTTAYFTVGTDGTAFGVSTTGYPVAALTSGALPGGLHFTDNGDGTGTISGTPSALTGGSYNVQITATNGVAGSPVMETITIYVDQAPAITTAASTTFSPGVAGTFSVKTTGYPAPSLAQNTSLPSWLTFHDNGDGTALISGTPPTGMASGSVLFTITAQNGIGTNATQPFTLNISAGSESVTFNSSPSVASYTVDGTPYTGTNVLNWVIGSSHSISAATQTSGGTEYTFNNWSDGGPASQPSLTASTSTTSYTVTFNTLYQLTTAATTGGTVSPASGSFYAASSVVPVTATPGAGYKFTSWTGPVAGSSSASTTVTMSAPESVTANFSPLQALLIYPTSLNFPDQKNNTSSTQIVTLTNQGSTAISISNVKIPGSNIETISNGDADDFSFVNHCGSSLGAGKSCTINVKFAADNDDLNPYASLVITDNATGSPQSVPITANILDPLISLSSSSMSFGNVTHLTSAAKTVTVKNTGLTALTLSGLSITGTGYAFTSPAPANSCTNATVLSPGGTCIVGVTFTPPAKSSYSGTVTITSDALNGATAKISLSGTGK